ncbi:MAG: hypothetical protein WKF91_23180 [Segetibacter sp.]
MIVVPGYFGDRNRFVSVYIINYPVIRKNTTVQALKSLLQQTKPNTEAIVIDDG